MTLDSTQSPDEDLPVSSSWCKDSIVWEVLLKAGYASSMFIKWLLEVVIRMIQISWLLFHSSFGLASSSRSLYLKDWSLNSRPPRLVPSVVEDLYSAIIKSWYNELLWSIIESDVFGTMNTIRHFHKELFLQALLLASWLLHTTCRAFQITHWEDLKLSIGHICPIHAICAKKEASTPWCWIRKLLQLSEHPPVVCNRVYLSRLYLLRWLNRFHNFPYNLTLL